jgi:hypothetical protein
MLVAGTLSPNAVGTYIGTGTYGGKPYYKLSTTFNIWFDTASGYYIISVVLGTRGTAYWEAGSDEPDGAYTPGGTATGTATVTKIP